MLKFFVAAIVLFTALTTAGTHAVINPKQQAASSGAVILTIAGKIGTANRGPVRPYFDGLFGHHNISFEKGLTLDRQTLKNLPQHVIRAETDQGVKTRFSGPLARDVLAAANITSGSVRVLGVDGFAADYPVADLTTQPWILALNMDGQALGVGDLGPLLLMTGPENGKSFTVKDRDRWVWGVFYIEAN